MESHRLASLTWRFWKEYRYSKNNFELVGGTGFEPVASSVSGTTARWLDSAWWRRIGRLAAVIVAGRCWLSPQLAGGWLTEWLAGGRRRGCWHLRLWSMAWEGLQAVGGASVGRVRRDRQGRDHAARGVDFLYLPQGGAWVVSAPLDGEQPHRVGVLRVVGPAPAVGEDSADEVVHPVRDISGDDREHASAAGEASDDVQGEGMLPWARSARGPALQLRRHEPVQVNRAGRAGERPADRAERLLHYEPLRREAVRLRADEAARVQHDHRGRRRTRCRRRGVKALPGARRVAGVAGVDERPLDAPAARGRRRRGGLGPAEVRDTHRPRAWSGWRAVTPGQHVGDRRRDREQAELVADVGGDRPWLLPEIAEEGLVPRPHAVQLWLCPGGRRREGLPGADHDRGCDRSAAAEGGEVGAGVKPAVLAGAGSGTVAVI